MGYVSTVHAAAAFLLLYCIVERAACYEYTEGVRVCYPGSPWGKRHIVGDRDNSWGNYTESAVQCYSSHPLQIGTFQETLPMYHNVNDGDASWAGFEDSGPDNRLGLTVLQAVAEGPTRI